MTGRRPRIGAAIVALGVTALTRAVPALACPVCFGDPNNAQTKATRAAVFFLMGLTALVVGGVIRIFVRIARRTRDAGSAAAAPPPDAAP